MNRNALIAPALILVVTLITAGCASMARTNPQQLSEPIERIVNFPELSKDEIYQRSRIWFSEYYNSAEAVITFEDTEAGIIRGTGAGNVRYSLYTVSFLYNISVEAREGRARFRASNPRHNPMGTYWLDPTMQDQFDLYAESIQETFNSLENSINSNPEDW